MNKNGKEAAKKRKKITPQDNDTVTKPEYRYQNIV